MNSLARTGFWLAILRCGCLVGTSLVIDFAGWEFWTTRVSLIVSYSGAVALSLLGAIWRLMVISSALGEIGSGLGCGEGLKPAFYCFLPTLRIVMRGFTFSAFEMYFASLICVVWMLLLLPGILNNYYFVTLGDNWPEFWSYSYFKNAFAFPKVNRGWRFAPS